MAKFKVGDRVKGVMSGRLGWVTRETNSDPDQVGVVFDGGKKELVRVCLLEKIGDEREDKMGIMNERKPDDVFEVTGEALRRMAEKCPTAAQVLKEGFPAAFEKKEEWDDVTDKCSIKIKTGGGVKGWWIEIYHYGEDVGTVTYNKTSSSHGDFRIIPTEYGAFKIERRVK